MDSPNAFSLPSGDPRPDSWGEVPLVEGSVITPEQFDRVEEDSINLIMQIERLPEASNQQLNYLRNTASLSLKLLINLAETEHNPLTGNAESYLKGLFSHGANIASITEPASLEGMKIASNEAVWLKGDRLATQLQYLQDAMLAAQGKEIIKSTSYILTTINSVMLLGLAVKQLGGMNVNKYREDKLRRLVSEYQNNRLT